MSVHLIHLVPFLAFTLVESPDYEKLVAFLNYNGLLSYTVDSNGDVVAKTEAGTMSYNVDDAGIIG